MKKLFLMAVAVAALSLSACDGGIGKLLSEEEAKDVIADIESKGNSKVYRSYTLTADSESISETEAFGESTKTKSVSKMVTEINKDTLYFHETSTVTDTSLSDSEAEPTNAKIERWTYYQNGYLYNAEEYDSEGDYNKEEMSKEDANRYFAEIFDDYDISGAKFVGGLASSITEAFKELEGLIDIDLDEVETTAEYYSNGNGNLTIKNKITTPEETKSAKIIEDDTITINKYNFASSSSTYSFEGTMSILGYSVGMKIDGKTNSKVSKGCKASKPAASKFEK